ncbi:DUF2071 domain-containing protein [Segniliparus rugosus]|uniref:Uncharacterized protein n=1 Tax=Segniliparus rugosus (strain ATCC BAA-974 / DSM 45345 / CCUG 50838 / CIP 108380 / JCM 13579 / CDC 945) TaxID=679197 RepID=E5XNS2_SEGRC|nr:DUF2071 domain-containing protein [Segniliparus rugosus]EFV13992.1 hypothetical protein HMPREF9336_01143 [Segniliparus rugosus ATCC BAA-974]
MQVSGHIQRRLLVNFVADPDEVRPRLPQGVRPHVTGSGVVVGCCLLRFGQVRPDPLPDFLGLGFQAAAHRISVEWEAESGATTVGVYVPVRHTDSRLLPLVGGRIFPGVHERADIRHEQTGDLIDWAVATRGASCGFDVAVRARIDREAEPVDVCDQIAGACVNANVGVSPGHNGALEAVRMVPKHREAREIAVEHIESAFLAGFASARPAPSYLIEDVGVAWAEASLPRQALRAAA